MIVYLTWNDYTSDMDLVRVSTAEGFREIIAQEAKAEEIDLDMRFDLDRFFKEIQTLPVVNNIYNATSFGGPNVPFRIVKLFTGS